MAIMQICILIQGQNFSLGIVIIEKWKIPSKYIERRAYIDKYRRDLIKAKSKEITIKKRKSLKKKNRMDYDLEQFLDN